MNMVWIIMTMLYGVNLILAVKDENTHSALGWGVSVTLGICLTFIN